MFPVVIVDLGLTAAFLGIVSLMKPIHFLAIGSRLAGLVVLGSGLVVVVLGALLPAQEVRIEPARSELDRLMPAYQFHEFHVARVSANREHAYQAVKGVTADEILFFRALTWMRRFGRPGKESILNPPPHEPLLAVAGRTSFILLAEKPGYEVVYGTLVAVPRGWRPTAAATPENFEALNAPGFALATINFLVEECGPASCTISTETRVYATDATTRRRFAGYWRLIYPGSALIRRMWLRAIVARAAA